MLKLTRTYVDFDGETRKEDFHFNLSQAEVLELETSKAKYGGIQKMLDKIVEDRDMDRIIQFFKEILLKAYGEKSADGKYFHKSPELSEAFSQTQAYSDLFVELALNTDKMNEFMNAIIPKTSAMPNTNVVPLT